VVHKSVVKCHKTFKDTFI